jgi:hypothetical protein
MTKSIHHLGCQKTQAHDRGRSTGRLTAKARGGCSAPPQLRGWIRAVICCSFPSAGWLDDAGSVLPRQAPPGTEPRPQLMYTVRGPPSMPVNHSAEAAGECSKLNRLFLANASKMTAKDYRNATCTYRGGRCNSAFGARGCLADVALRRSRSL